MDASQLFPSARPYRIKNLVDQPFGLLTVLSFAGMKPRNPGARASGRAAWLCRCVCGTELVVLSQSLLSHATKSCGCRGDPYRTPPGLRKRYPQEHRIWGAMWERCTNPRHTAYIHYGARGITVDPRWRRFRTFLNDMGVRPGPAYSLERINNDLGYSKSNCCWATRQEQMRNTRRNHWLTHNGVTKCIADWAQDLGMHVQTLRSRLKAGLPPEEVFSSILRGREEITHNGVTQCVAVWARDLGIHEMTLRSRIKAGLPEEQVFSSARLKRRRGPTKRNRMLTYEGVTLCLTDWATRLGISEQSLSKRLKRGLPLAAVFLSGPQPRRTINTSRYQWVTYQGVTKCLQDWAHDLGIHPTTFKHRITAGFPEEQIFSSTHFSNHRRPMRSKTTTTIKMRPTTPDGP